LRTSSTAASITLCGSARLRIGFRVSILASGSSGNCTLLETERTCLLVDAGINRKEMGRRLESLGIKPERLDGFSLALKDFAC